MKGRTSLFFTRRHAFLKEDGGSVSAEFVILFPLLLMLLFAIVFISMLISVTSDVQQVAHDLARASFRFIGQPGAGDICADLRRYAVPVLVDSTLLLRPDSFTLLPCPGQPDAAGMVTITVSYDFAGSMAQAIGASFGLDIGIITRTSRIIP